MHLRTETGAEFAEPDNDTVENVIRGLLQNPDESFAVLAEPEEQGIWMQASPNDASTFYVEYAIGGYGEREHYRMENVSIESVIPLFQSFNSVEISWKDAYPWIDVTSEIARPASDSWREFKDDTGRSVDEWLQLIWTSGPKDHNARKEWLKTEYGLSGRLSAMLANVAGPEIENSVNHLKVTQDLGVLIERSISAMRDGDQQAIEDCGRLVEQVKAVLNTTDDPGDKEWREIFDQVAQRLKSAAFAGSLSSKAEGVVYMLKAGPYYKIGRSIGVNQRLNQIKLQLPYPVEEVHRISTDDPTGVELYWHRRFSVRRANGEWFLLTDEDVAIFKSRAQM